MPAKPGGAERGLGPGRRQQGSRAASPATAAREQQLVATAACGPWSRCVCRAGHTRGRAWESGAWSRAWAQPGSAFSGAREPGWTGHPSRLPCLHLPCGKVASSPGPPAEPVVMRASGRGALHAHSRASAGLGHRPPPPPPRPEVTRALPWLGHPSPRQHSGLGRRTRREGGHGAGALTRHLLSPPVPPSPPGLFPECPRVPACLG